MMFNSRGRIVIIMGSVSLIFAFPDEICSRWFFKFSIISGSSEFSFSDLFFNILANDVLWTIFGWCCCVDLVIWC